MKTPGIKKLRRKGFSHTELLVVIAIMLILLGIGISSLPHSLRTLATVP